MADPFRKELVRPVTPDEVSRARSDRFDSTIKGAFVSLAPAAALAPFAGSKVAQPLKGLVHALTGITFKPVPNSIPKPTIAPKAALLYLAPAPVGIVPPEVYQLHPQLLAKEGINFPFRETVGVHGTDVRATVFEAAQFERQIAVTVRRAEALGTLDKIPTNQLVNQLTFLRATTAQERTTPAVRGTIAAELVRRERVAPGSIPAGLFDSAPVAMSGSATGPSDYGGDVLPGSLQPESIVPRADAAIRNAKAATGINRELVSERADP